MYAPHQEAKKHYDVVKEEYEKQVKKLTKLMDETADTVEFLGASGEYTVCNVYVYTACDQNMCVITVIQCCNVYVSLCVCALSTWCVCVCACACVCACVCVCVCVCVLYN